MRAVLLSLLAWSALVLAACSDSAAKATTDGTDRKGPPRQQLFDGAVTAICPCEFLWNPQTNQYKCYQPYKDRRITYQLSTHYAPPAATGADAEAAFQRTLGPPFYPAWSLCDSDLIQRVKPRRGGKCLVDNVPVSFFGPGYSDDSVVGKMYPAIPKQGGLLWVIVGAAIEGEVTPEMRACVDSIAFGAGARGLEVKGTPAPKQ